MTGFGRGTARGRGWRVVAELHAVNRKQTDLAVNLPRELQQLEPELRHWLLPRLARGRTTLSLTVERAAADRVNAPLFIDPVLAAAGLRELRAMARQLNLSEPLGIKEVLALPGVVRTPGDQLDLEQLHPLVLRAVAAGLRSLQVMQRTEGRALAADLKRRLQHLRKLHGKVTRRQPKAMSRQRRLLSKTVEKLASSHGLENDRLLREVVHLVDRCDITEELIRLQSHFDQFAGRLARKEPCGRTLEFLMQEIYREWNTIGSKANDSEIAAWVVDAKSEGEKIREQIQNLE